MKWIDITPFAVKVEVDLNMDVWMYVCTIFGLLIKNNEINTYNNE